MLLLRAEGKRPKLGGEGGIYTIRMRKWLIRSERPSARIIRSMRWFGSTAGESRGIDKFGYKRGRLTRLIGRDT